MPKKLILLIGAPGSGKSTDAKLIAKNHLDVISSYSTGDLIKKEIESGTGVGSIAKSFVEKGELVPTQIVVELIVDAVNNAPKNVVLLDGFPGKEKQLQYFCDHIFNNNNIQLMSVLEIKVNDDLAKKRWLDAGRNEEIFKQELESYKGSLAEIEEHYEGKNILKIIDGENDLDTVIKDIDSYLAGICNSF